MRISSIAKSAALGAACLALAAFGSGERIFAPSSELAPEWQAHDAASSITVDHGRWDAFLAKRVVDRPNGVNLVAYGAVTQAERAALDAYLKAMAATPVSRLARPEQKAYWINLYNALTVSVVLQHYPVDSIRDIDISPGLFADGPWGKKLIEVDGRQLSLNDIEHRILRPIWNDPRIHYAVNCAAIGCPDLGATAYRAATLDAQLDAAARAYVNTPRGVEIVNGRVVVSKIYDWFIEDFGGSADTVLAHLLRYAEPDLKARLQAIGKLEDVRYDWSLNDAKG